MAKFVLNIYQLKIAEYIAKNLEGTKDTYNYLCTLYDLYLKYVLNYLCIFVILKYLILGPINYLVNYLYSILAQIIIIWINWLLTSSISMWIIISSMYYFFSRQEIFFNQINNMIVAFHIFNYNCNLDSLFSLELKCLRERNSSNLQKYYESKHHQKKPLQSGG